MKIIKNRKISAVLLTGMLLFTTLFSREAVLVAHANTITAANEAVNYTVATSTNDEGLSVDVIIQLETKENVTIHTITLPDGTTQEYTNGIIEYKALQNGMAAFLLNYSVTNVQEDIEMPDDETQDDQLDLLVAEITVEEDASQNMQSEALVAEIQVDIVDVRVEVESVTKDTLTDTSIGEEAVEARTFSNEVMVGVGESYEKIQDALNDNQLGDLVISLTGNMVDTGVITVPSTLSSFTLKSSDGTSRELSIPGPTFSLNGVSTTMENIGTGNVGSGDIRGSIFAAEISTDPTQLQNASLTLENCSFFNIFGFASKFEGAESYIGNVEININNSRVSYIEAVTVSTGWNGSESPIYVGKTTVGNINVNVSNTVSANISLGEIRAGINGDQVNVVFGDIKFDLNKVIMKTYYGGGIIQDGGVALEYPDTNINVSAKSLTHKLTGIITSNDVLVAPLNQMPTTYTVDEVSTEISGNSVIGGSLYGFGAITKATAYHTTTPFSTYSATKVDLKIEDSIIKANFFNSGYIGSLLESKAGQEMGIQIDQLDVNVIRSTIENTAYFGIFSNYFDSDEHDSYVSEVKNSNLNVESSKFVGVLYLGDYSMKKAATNTTPERINDYIQKTNITLHATGSTFVQGIATTRDTHFDGNVTIDVGDSTVSNGNALNGIIIGGKASATVSGDQPWSNVVNSDIGTSSFTSKMEQKLNSIAAIDEVHLAKPISTKKIRSMDKAKVFIDSPELWNDGDLVIEVTEAIETISGTEFSQGWVTNDDCPFTLEFRKTAYTVGWYLKADRYKVQFEPNGGSSIANQNVLKFGLVEEPIVPIKSGFTFDGWFKEATLLTSWNFASDKIIENTILYAKWVETPTPPLPTVTPTPPLPTVTPTPKPTPDTGRTCQDDGYPDGYYWSESEQACIIDKVVVVPTQKPTIRPTIKPTNGPTATPDENNSEIVEKNPNTQKPTAVPTVDPNAANQGSNDKMEVGTKGSWSLVTMLASLSTILLTMVLIVMKKEDEEAAEGDKVTLYKRNKGVMWGSIVLSVISVIIVLLTQMFTQPMVWLDAYSLVMIMIMIIAACLLYFGSRWVEVE